MHVLVIGAAGMLGQKLVAALTAAGSLNRQAITQITLADVVAPAKPVGFDNVACHAADLSEQTTPARLISGRPDVIFHLAAIVSSEAESDFAKGYRVNLDGTRNLFEAIRFEGSRLSYCPRVVFTSSLAVYGRPFPDVIPDDFLLSPLTSYGTQKVIGELLLADYSRHKIFDGIGIRLPTISIRPGKPNRAASGFFSSILREPLIGLEAVLPVAESVRHWFASPRAATRFLVHAAEVDTAPLGGRRSLDMPGLTATVGDQIAALSRVAGESAVKLIHREPNPAIAKIIDGWPQAFDATRALQLGFRAESSFDEIIRVHIEDEIEVRRTK